MKQESWFYNGCLLFGVVKWNAQKQDPTGSLNQIIGNQQLIKGNWTIINRQEDRYSPLFDYLLDEVVICRVTGSNLVLIPMHITQRHKWNIVYFEAKLGGRNRGWKRDENVALHNKDSFYLPYNRSVEFLFHPGTKVQPRILEFKVRLGISGRSNFFQVETKKRLGISVDAYTLWMTGWRLLLSVFWRMV